MTALVWIGVVIALIYFVMQSYFALVWMRMSTPTHKSSPSQEWPPVSVLVPMRNEEDRILPCLHSLIEQQYHDFEIICLDNHSEDGSSRLVASIGDSRIRLIKLGDYLPEGETFKKEAIEFGVQQAQHDHILATDADCTFAPTWIASMMATWRQTDSDYVVGPIRLSSEGKSILVDFQLLDYAGLLVLTGAGITSSTFISSFGPNHGFTRSAFHKVGGYSADRHHRSGDDIFLAQAMRRSGHAVGFIKDKTALVSFEAVTSWSDLFQQRLRWLSKAQSLQLGSRFLALIPASMSLMVVLLFVTSLLGQTAWKYFMLIWLSKIFADTLLILPGLMFMERSVAIRSWLAAHLIQPFYVLTLMAMHLLGIRPKWKGRRI